MPFFSRELFPTAEKRLFDLVRRIRKRYSIPSLACRIHRASALPLKLSSAGKKMRNPNPNKNFDSSPDENSSILYTCSVKMSRDFGLAFWQAIDT